MGLVERALNQIGANAIAGLAAARSRNTFASHLAGHIRMPGLDGPVEILRDRWGTPHIRAVSLHDLMFGQGFAQAEDRLWQLDLNRRAASGTLSEIFGPRALEIDRLYRTIGFRRSAEREWQRVEGEGRLVLEAFSRGVNAGRAILRRPFESWILRYRIAPWTPIDTLAFLKLMAHGLAMNWDSELARMELADCHGGQAVRASESSYSAGLPLAGSRAQSRGRPLPPLADFVYPPGGASNGWAVSGARSATGRPLIAGDPHVRGGLPSAFWLNHLTAGNLDVVGFSVPGLPLVVSGHNQRIAWSVTAAMTDVQDLYVEEFDSVDDSRYFHQGEWKTTAIYREVIRVRGRQPVTLRVRETIHGPVISDALPNEKPNLALRSTILDSRPLATQSALDLDRAIDWHSFRAALRDWTYPPLNFVYADVDGHVGYQMAGALPIRTKGRGVTPVPGGGGWDWQGEADLDALPQAFDPPNGLVVSANNRPAEKKGGPFLGFEWVDGFRAARVHDLIESQPLHDVSSFRNMQGDLFSAPLRAIADEILVVRSTSAAEVAALDFLREWDGVLHADSPAGAIVHVVRRRLLEVAVNEQFPSATQARLGVGPHVAVPANSYAFRNSSFLIERIKSWRDDGSWPRRARTVLAEAVTELLETLGSPAQWRWGRLHELTFRHPLGAVEQLSWLFSHGPHRVGGDTDTVCQTGLDPGQGYRAAAWYPAVRQIHDLADWDASRAVLPGGQSGNPLSRNYTDQVADWLANRDHPLPYSTRAVESSAVRRIVLES